MIPPPPEFVADYQDWIERRNAIRARFEKRLPCLAGASCGYHVDACENCRLVFEAVAEIGGPSPHPGDYFP